MRRAFVSLLLLPLVAGFVGVVVAENQSAAVATVPGSHQSVTAIADAYTRHHAPRARAGKAFRWATGGDARSKRRAYLMFRIPAPAEGTVISSVDLAASLATPRPIHRKVSVFRTRTRWHERTLSWRNQPRLRSRVASSAHEDTSTPWMTWDVTRALTQHQRRHGGLVSFAVVTSGRANVRFKSRESGQAPVLNLTMEPKVGFTTPTGSPTSAESPTDSPTSTDAPTPSTSATATPTSTPTTSPSTTPTATATPTTTPTPGPTAPSGSGPLLVGARTNDIPWQQAAGEVGALKVTRLFYGTLPPKFTRQGIPDGVLLIVSYKTQTTNVASYVASIPKTQAVQLVYHHEPEADYASGSTYVSEFNAQEQIAHRANPAVPFAFIAGGYQYGSPRLNGYDGSFIPPAADRYYLDSYQQGVPGSIIRPASQTPSIQRYITLLRDRGKQWNGFTEYGRGMTDITHPLTDALVQQRLAVFAADNAYLRSLPGVQVWSYWYTSDAKTAVGAVKQWRLTDAASQQAWRNIVQAR